MLPYTPLHHLLLLLLGAPVVATSGNMSDEPICTDEREALERLSGIADLFLVHNRPIVRHVDDSIVRVMMGREMVLRRARGYAPLPIQLHTSIGSGPPTISNAILAVGAHLKNTIALSVGPQVFLSQHIGDLETDQAFEAFRRVAADFQNLYEVRPEIIVADAHPDYLSTRFAHDLVSGSGRRKEAEAPVTRLITVQHHAAHVLSCMAENELEPPLLGVSWDGTGYGLDHTVWGGEFFLVTAADCERVAHLRQFRLPGGDRSVKEPRRTALGLLHEMYGDAAFAMADLAPLRAFLPADLEPLKTMLGRGLNSPLTSSAGRLFDAVAALVGLRQQTRFEGQAAMELEFALEAAPTTDAYELPLRTAHAARILDWAPTIAAIRSDLVRGTAVGTISARFHQALAEAIVAVARETGQKRVVLSGGCFQNRYLTERTVHRLREEGFLPYWHQRVPPNDGGIALGQIVAALRASGSARPA
jgi:hydrogenase maturation protein HypF